MEFENQEQEIINYQLELPFGQNQVIFINDAVVDSVNFDRGTTYVTASYEQRFFPGQQGRGRRQQVVLVVSRATRIQDNSGNPVNVNQLRPGTRMNALISAAMTRSIPPQAQAFIIIVNTRARRNEVAEGRIVDIERRRNTFVIREQDRDRDGGRDRGRGRDSEDDNDNDNRQNRIRFYVDENTRFLDRNGRSIRFRDVSDRDRVRVEYQQLQDSSRDRVNIAIVVQLI